MIGVENHGRGRRARRRRRIGGGGTADSERGRGHDRHRRGAVRPSPDGRQRGPAEGGRRAVQAGDASRDVEKRAPQEPPRGQEGRESDGDEEHLFTGRLLQPAGEVVAGDREPVDAAEAMQRDDRHRLAGDEQGEHSARLETFLHAGTVRCAI
jgi:hypothetical protein